MEVSNGNWKLESSRVLRDMTIQMMALHFFRAVLFAATLEQVGASFPPSF